MVSRKNILVHLPFPIKPPESGARRRIVGILEYFKARQEFFAADAVARNPFGIPEWTPEQEQEVLKFVDNFFVYRSESNYFDFAYSRAQSFYYQKLLQEELPIDSRYTTPPGYINFVRRLKSKKAYDFIWINGIDNSHLAIDPKFSSIHTLIDMHDLGCDRCLARKNIPYLKNLKFDYEANFIKEVKLLNKFDTVVANSLHEMGILKSHIPSNKLYCIPHLVEELNSVSSEAPYQSRRFEYDLLFVGTSYKPNIDGINFFLSSIFPKVISGKPDTRLGIVGKVNQYVQIDPSLKRNVDCLGYVPNLSEPYLKSKIIICPLQQGSGTKVKLQEAMAYALPIVTTTTGASGLELKDGVNAFITDEPEVYAQKILHLLMEPELAQKISQEIARTFENTYSNSAVYAKLDQMFGLVPT